MATIGERIQRARLARQMSGEALARAVGYKQQSAISNLENRGGGTGGNKLPEIARVLRVPLDWLMQGPDDQEVPFSEPLPRSSPSEVSRIVAERPSIYDVDASLKEASELFVKLRTEQRLQAIQFMHQLLASNSSAAHKGEVGESDSVPHHRAA